MGDSDVVSQLDPICDLFRQGDPDGHTMSAFMRWILPVGCAGLGLGTVVAANVIGKRPVYAGIYRHVIATTVGLAIGEYFHRLRKRVTAERDLQFYHYMTLHPEDFPPPKRVLFRDYLEPWPAIR